MSEDQITKLSEEWYDLISGQHHKDRDCHWSIEVKWSYGYPPVYVVLHEGYLLDSVEESFETYEDALEYLGDVIKRGISDEKQNQTKADEW